jgi:hypothetical protein
LAGHTPWGPNIPAEVNPTVPPSRLNHTGLASTVRQVNRRTGRGNPKKAKTLLRRCSDPGSPIVLAWRISAVSSWTLLRFAARTSNDATTC